jgi:hypothetical protein
MTQLLAMPQSGDRLIFGSFQAGQVGMLDVTDPARPFQLDFDTAFSTGPAQPHGIEMK